MAGSFDFQVFDWSAFEATPGFFLDAEVRLNKQFRINAFLCKKFTVNATLLWTHIHGASLDAFVHTLTNAQVSQSVLEVLVLPSDANARVSQVAIEVLIPRFSGSVSINAIIQITKPLAFTLDAAFVPAHFFIDAIKRLRPVGSFVVDAYIEPVLTYNQFTINADIHATVGPGLRPLTFPGSSRTRSGLTVNVLSPAFPINAGEQAVVVVVSPPSDGGDLGIAGTVSGGYSVPVAAGEHDVAAAPGQYFVVSSKDNTYRPSLSGAGFYKDWGVSSLQFTISAFIQPRFTIDARFCWTFAFDFTVEAAKRRSMVATFTVGAFIQPYFRVDALVAARRFRLDAWIKCEFPVAAWIIRKVAGSFTVGAFVRPTITLDAVLVRRVQGTFSIGSWFVHPRYGSFPIDAFIRPYLFISASIRVTKYRTFSVSAWKILQPVSTFSVAAFVRPSFRIDAVFLAHLPGLFEIPVDAYIVHLVYGTFGIDAFIEGAVQIDATFLRTTAQSTYLDAAVVFRPVATFTLNASITGFGVDAVLKTTQTVFFFLFAVKGSIHGASSFSIDAERRDPEAYWDPITETWLHLHFLVDSIVSIHPTGSFKVAAAIIYPGQPIISWFIDAQITTVVRSTFTLEADISSEHTVVFEGTSEVTVRVLNQITARLDFPGTSMVLPDGSAGDNVLSGPFWPPAFQPVTITIWGEINDPNVSIGIDSANENLWANPYVVNQGSGQITVVRGGTTTITCWPAYYFEPHYAYAWTDGVYKPYMTGSGLLTYSQFVDIVVSSPAPTIDAWIVGTIGTPFSIDAEIVEREKTGTFTLKADLAAQGEVRGTLTVGASIRSSSVFFFHLFANLASCGFTMDAVVWQPSGTIDAFIQPFLTVDAYLVPVKTTGTGTFRIRAWTSYLQSMNQMHIDAEIVSMGDMRGGASIDAVLIGGRSSRFYLAAAFGLPPAGFDLDAMIAPWFGVDAWIGPVGGGLGAFTVGAYVRGSSYIIFPGDGGAPTDPFGNPPALSRKFGIKIEAGFPQPMPHADPDLVASILEQIATLQAQLAALLCIPVGERIPAEVAAIKSLNEQIAEQDLKIAAALSKDPSNQWLDRLGHVAQDIIRYQTIHSTSRTAQQVDALRRAWDSYYYATTMYRRSRAPQRTWVDITGDCIWSGTEFTQMARTGPGTFTITLKGAHSEFEAGEEIHFEIDGLRVFGGWVTDVERGYFFSDFAQPKTVLHGTDYNILFDRLVIRNYPWEFANYGKTGQEGGVYRSWPAFKKGTLDSAMIRAVFSRYVAPDLPPEFDYTTGVESITTPAPVSSWVMPEAGSTLRMFMQSVSQITTGVWYIDPYMVLQYHDRAKVTAPYPLTDGLGGISSRGLSVTTDISQMVNDVLVWGTLAKTIEGQIMVFHEEGNGTWWSTYWRAEIQRITSSLVDLYNIPPGDRTDAEWEAIDHYKAQRVIDKARLLYVETHTWDPDSGDPRPPDAEIDSIGHWGRWQYGEFREEIHHEDWLRKRGHSILVRFDEPIFRATATVWDPGYQAGQVVNVKSSVYGVDINLVIRQLHISFTVPKEPLNGAFYALPQYDLEMGLDPEAPWNIYDFLPYPGQSTAGVRMDTTGG